MPIWSIATSPLPSRSGQPIVAVFETHVQADHVSGLPELVERTGATAYLPVGAGVDFEHTPLDDGAVVELGNTRVTAIATPGHAPAHHAYAVSDLRRGTPEPWLVFTGDSLLIGDVGRPDLHVAGDALGQARSCMRRCGGCSSSPTTWSCFPATMPGRCAAGDCPGTRSPRSGSSALTTRCSRSRMPARSPRHWSRTRRRGRLSRRGSWPPIAAARPARRHDQAGSPRPARERRPVLAPSCAERACRWNGRPGAKRPAAGRRA